MSADAIDLLSPELYGEVAQRAYARLRTEGPVHLDEVNGLWGVTTYDAVLEVERDTERFSSAGGTRPGAGPMPWMIDMDGAAHSTRRRLVSGGFTPKQARASAGRAREICDELIDAVCEAGSCDLVRDLAAPLPMIVIGDMLGVPSEDRATLLEWSDALLGSLGGSAEQVGAAAEAFSAYQEYAARLAAQRRSAPTEDLFSVLVHAEVDGARLSDDDILFESLLLLVGGDESTRHVISGGMEAVLRDRATWDGLGGAVDLPTAVEEMLRWVTPIKQMARTVVADTELGGVPLAAGDVVVLLYESANFDPAHFETPERFDAARSPNDHLAFGFGPHHCLGASLARVEVGTMVERLRARLPDLVLADDADPPRFLGALQSLPVTFTPAPRSTA